MPKKERVLYEKRILEILELINHPIKNSLRENIFLFSNRELFQIMTYLETWDLNPIDQFLDEKKEEYLLLFTKLKASKRFARLEWIKLQEKLEKEEDNIEKIEFNF